VQKYLAIIVLTLLLAACSSMPDGSNPVLAPNATQPAPQPYGAAAYCSQPPAEAGLRFWNAFCQAQDAPATVPLTERAWTELQDVQTMVNRALPYRPTSSWDPLAAAGDCKTATARKELELLDRGWPAGALRIATVFVNDHGPQQLAYHSVLLVDTDHGTIVLDSRQADPKGWEDLPYIWMTAEMPGTGGSWSRLPADPRDVQMAMLANAGQAAPAPSASFRQIAATARPSSD
jgi:predicted transglutaminase-like cysteine proteinase